MNETKSQVEMLSMSLLGNWSGVGVLNCTTPKMEPSLMRKGSSPRKKLDVVRARRD